MLGAPNCDWYSPRDAHRRAPAGRDGHRSAPRRGPRDRRPPDDRDDRLRLLRAVDHPVQRPARADDRRARGRVRARTRHQGQRAQQRRGRARRADRAEGSNSPADVFYTENSPPLEYLQAQHLPRPVDRRDARRHAGPLQLADRRLGRRVGPRSVLVYNTQLLRPRSCRRSVLDLAEPRCEGQARARARRDRLPADRDRRSPRAYGTAAALRGSRRSRRTRRPQLSRQRDASPTTVNRGHAAIGLINQYYWYRLRAEIGAGATCTPRSPTSRRTTPATSLDVSGAGVLESSRHQAGAAAVRRVPREHGGPEDHRRTATASSTRSPRASRPRRPRRPSTSSQPDSDRRRRPRRRLRRDRPARAGAAALSRRRGACRRRARPRRATHPGRPARRPAAVGTPPLLAASPARSSPSCSLLPARVPVVEAAQAGWSTSAGCCSATDASTLLWNTVRLTVVVTVLCAVIGTLAAWCVERTDLPAGALWAVLVVVPSRIPDFVVELRLAVAVRRRSRLPRRGPRHDARRLPARLPAGRGQPARADPATRRSPAASGSAAFATFLRVTLRQARGAILGGCLLVALVHPRRVRRVRDPRLPDLHHRDLHRVLIGFDSPAACALSLVLVVLGLLVLGGEELSRGRGREQPRPGRSRSAHSPRGIALGRGRWPVLGFAALVGLALGVPVGAIVYWIARRAAAPRCPASRSARPRCTRRSTARGRPRWRPRRAAGGAPVRPPPPPHGVCSSAAPTSCWRCPGWSSPSRSVLHRRYATGCCYQTPPMLVVCLRDHVLPARPRGGAGLRRPGPAASRRSPRPSAAGRWRCFCAGDPAARRARASAAAFCLVFLSAVTELTATLHPDSDRRPDARDPVLGVPDRTSPTGGRALCTRDDRVAAVPSYVLGALVRPPARARGARRHEHARRPRPVQVLRSRTGAARPRLTVPAGSFAAMLGASGSGKTTLLRVIAGFEHADRGTIASGRARRRRARTPPGGPTHRLRPPGGRAVPPPHGPGNVGFGLRARRAARVASTSCSSSSASARSAAAIPTNSPAASSSASPSPARSPSPAAAAARRAVLRARRLVRASVRADVRELVRAGRDDRRPRHPRPGGGPVARRPGRRHPRRPHRPARNTA